MAASRFFVSAQCAPGIEVDLDPADAHHASDVLRLKRGDRIVVTDFQDAWTAEIVDARKHTVRARVIGASEEPGAELPVEITVLQAIAKGAKFDDVVEKTVELGARRIVPVRCARGYADASFERIERWRRIARAAAQQSRRRIVPDVEEPLIWAAAMERFSAGPLLVAYERAAPGSFRAACDSIGDAGRIAIAVGSEGGLTDDEIIASRGAHAYIVSLGPTTLRTETAAAAMIAALAASLQWW